MILEGDAHLPTDPATRLEIAKNIWCLPNASDLKCESYFVYYEKECREMIQNGDPQGILTTVRKHTDIVKIAHQLNASVPKAQIEHELINAINPQTTQKQRAGMALGSVVLTARLLSMTNIGPLCYGAQRRKPIPWPDNAPTLKAVLEQRFKKPDEQADCKMRFQAEFTAFNIQLFTQMKIKWTVNLDDHLQLLDGDKHLCIFHHDTFLQYQKSNVFPEGLLDETRRTLDLLFPKGDKKSMNWLKEEVEKEKLDKAILNRHPISSENRRVKSYEFWHERLSILKEEFDHPSVVNLSQSWYDTRNQIQQATFWIAIAVFALTIFFGLVQSTEGALQVYKAYHPS